MIKSWYKISLIAIVLLISAITDLRAEDYNWTVPVNLQRLNSRADDFAPAWNQSQNLLYYCSSKSGYSNFYTASMTDSAAFSEPQWLESDINTKKSNVSYIAFYGSDKAVYSAFSGFDTRSYLNLYQSVRKRTNWLIASNIGELQCSCFVAHPAVSSDGNTMIYVSDKNSDFGDTDLWMVIRQENGGWGAATCLTNLKSPGNEITPYLATDDTLYFASDGQEGPGGYDLFMSVRLDGVWQRPQPLEQFNTEYDESDFTLINPNLAVFASNRPGGAGKLDLYISQRLSVKEPEIRKDDIELSIAAQVPSIKSQTIYNCSSYILSPIINQADLKNLSKKSTEALSPEIDEINANLLNIIGERMAGSAASLTIKAKDSSTANVIMSFLRDNYQTDQSRLNIKIDESLSDVMLETEDAQLLAPFLCGNGTSIIMPPVLDITLDARPRKNLADWTFTAELADMVIGKATGKELPATATIRLDSAKFGIKNFDSLHLSLEVTDSLLHKTKTALNIPITHQSLRTKTTKPYQSGYYEEYIYKPQNSIADRAVLGSFVASLKEPVNILIFETGNLNGIQLEALTADLKGLLKNSKSKIRTDNSKNRHETKSKNFREIIFYVE